MIVFNIFLIKIDRFRYKFDLLIDLNRSNVNYLIENGRFISKIVHFNQKLVEFDRNGRFILKKRLVSLKKYIAYF